MPSSLFKLLTDAIFGTQRVARFLALAGLSCFFIASTILVVLLVSSTSGNRGGTLESATTDLHRSLSIPSPKHHAVPKTPLDFVIAGFPKCGTTTLLYTFARHNETEMLAKTEKCVLINPFITDAAAISKLLLGAPSSNDGDDIKKRAIKCPTGIRNIRSLERLDAINPRVKLILGVRHPVHFLASYYNYRITELYDKHLLLDENNHTITVPPIESLLDEAAEWKGVSADQARYELFLLQLGKTNVTTDDLSRLQQRPHMGIKANSFEIFLYDIHQLEDPYERRAWKFRRDLQDFLGLAEPIPAFGHENHNHFVGQKAHAETVDLCDDRYVEFRRLLIQRGRYTADWIRTNFLQSPDVYFSNPKHLYGLLKEWGDDPCEAPHWSTTY